MDNVIKTEYCLHEDTIDVGDEDHILVACTKCEKVLEPYQDYDDIVRLYEVDKEVRKNELPNL